MNKNKEWVFENGIWVREFSSLVRGLVDGAHGLLIISLPSNNLQYSRYGYDTESVKLIIERLACDFYANFQYRK